MSIYGKFAHLYETGEYPEFSARIAQLLPPVLRRFHVRPKEIWYE